MRVLIACEFSGVVRDAFIARGHDAISCDILPTEAPGPHIEGDALALLYRADGSATAFADSLDLLIAHPPCTYLANSGVAWLYGGRGTVRDEARWDKMRDGAAFFASLLHAPVRRIAVENPIMHKHGKQAIGPHADIQTVQPWMFGHAEQKATQLWLTDLPRLVPTNNVRDEMMALTPGERQRLHWLSPGPKRAHERSRTFTGLAAAMAEQWGDL